MIVVEIAGVINQAVVDTPHRGDGGGPDASAAFGGCS